MCKLELGTRNLVQRYAGGIGCGVTLIYLALKFNLIATSFMLASGGYSGIFEQSKCHSRIGCNVTLIYLALKFNSTATSLMLASGGDFGLLCSH